MTARFYGENTHGFFGGFSMIFLGDVGWHSPRWKGDKKTSLSNPKKTKKRLRKKNTKHRDLFLKKKTWKNHIFIKDSTTEAKLSLFSDDLAFPPRVLAGANSPFRTAWSTQTCGPLTRILRKHWPSVISGATRPVAAPQPMMTWEIIGAKKKRSLRARAVLMTWIEATDFGESQVMGEQVGWKGAVVDETFETLNWRFIVAKCIFYNLRIHVALGCNEKNPPKDTHEIADLPLPSYPTFPLAKCPPYLLK